MKNYNFKILTVIIILSILVTSCAINSKDKAKETEINDICQDISDIKDGSNPRKKILKMRLQFFYLKILLEIMDLWITKT
ncbi:hypothetical protein [Vallitalea maricola]|uniref:Uncharacterized protein n=1 Tax=Vallitalea maricola TaxID=3074433 RepID=A0ACB5UEP7_9FIRM|nr:hypothetical protein AN2V17_01480 [Vallitalea sp. AN17-2]